MPSKTLLARLVGDSSSMVDAFNKADGASAALGKVGRQAGVGLAAMGAGAVAGFALSINKAMDFESAIDSIAAVSQATDPELKGLTDTALRLGKDTKFSALEAAAAMESLAANGISAKDIIGGAADAAVNLAAAGGTDLVTAADLAATAMTVWGLKTSDMGDVVNRLAGAANVSRFGVEDMALAVAQGGGVAAAAGIEFADFATAIAAIAPSFASGSDAGTSFKAFVNNLTPTVSKTKNLMKDLGIITKDGSNQFFDAAGNVRSMAEISGVLNTALGSLTEQDRARALEQMFGSDGMRAAGQIMKHNAESFAEMQKKMGETDALELAKLRMDNAKGSMEQLAGAIEVMQISVGAKFLPVIKDVANFLATNLPKIPTEVLIAAGAVVALVGAFAAVAIVVGPIITLFAALIPVAAGLGIGIVALGGIFLAIPLAIAAAIAAGVLIWRNWDTIKDRAGDLAEWVTIAFGRIRDFVVGIFENDLVQSFLRIAILFSPAGPLMLLWTFKDQIIGALSGLYDALEPILGPVIGLFGGIADKVGDLLGLIGKLPGAAASLGMAAQTVDVSTPTFAASGNPDMFGEGEGFDSGGVIPGRRGAPVVIKAHAGETVLPTHKGGAFGNTYVTVEVQGNTLQSDAQLQQLFLEALSQLQQRGVRLGIS